MIEDAIAEVVNAFGLEKLIIEVIGINKINCNGVGGIRTDCDLQIVGSGEDPHLNINLDAQEISYQAITVYGEKLTIKDVTVKAIVEHAAAPAIAVGSTIGTLVVDNADLRAAVVNSPVSDAISCLALEMLNGVELRHDDEEWKAVTWESDHFEGADRTHIWIGKNESFPTDIENQLSSASQDEKAMKVLRNGQLLIIRDGRTYTVSGLEIR